ncbi:hypothetical protein BDZ97DRAFT_1365170 [Flammula alnicola]|nr:hypothetical protein BDZ97DRAFT_1365170 [Flammula alnicola]
MFANCLVDYACHRDNGGTQDDRTFLSFSASQTSNLPGQLRSYTHKMPMSNADSGLKAEGGKSIPPRQRDGDYYLDTVMIVFEVENTLFRLQKKGFEVPGSFFETMFSLPGHDRNGLQGEGHSDQCPIVLNGISISHFRGFLHVMKTLMAGPATTYEQWLGALHLATQWDCFDIRKQAITELSRFLRGRDGVELIPLARKYNVKEWLIQGYMHIAQQIDALDIDKLGAAMLDHVTITRFFVVRDMILVSFRKSCRGYYSTDYTFPSDEEIRKLVTDKFSDELRDME